MNKNWNLVDRLDYQDKEPTVEHHSSDEKDKLLEKGSKVRLIFHTPDNDSEKQLTELLWVEILLVQGEKYLGQLEDDPKIISKLIRGEMIDFENRHIYESEYIDPFDSSIKV